MKAKVSRGCKVGGLLRYAFDAGPKSTHSKQAEQISGNMIGRDIHELEMEFGIVCRLRPDITKPVWHCSLSLPQGEKLDRKKWDTVVADFLQQMEFDLRLTQYVAVRHQDTKYDHVHIIVSRVGMNGKVWLGQWEARRVIEATQALELSHGLIQTQGLGDDRAAKRQPGSGEFKMVARTGEESVRSKLQRFVDLAATGNPTAVEFAARMVEQGAEVRVNLSKAGDVNGFSYQLDDICFQSSQLGKQYAWRGLQERGVTYERDRDHAALLKLSHQPAVDLKANDDNTTLRMIVGIQEHAGSSAAESPHVEAVAASKNTDSVERLKLGSQVTMSDAGLVNVDTHHAEVADPRVGNTSVSTIEEISSESLPPGISNEATAGGSAVANDSQDAEAASICELIAEAAESAQAEMEIDSGFVGFPETKEGDGDLFGADSGSIGPSNLLTPSAEDPVLTEVGDKKEYYLALSAGAAEDGVHIFETIQASETENTLLMGGEKFIVQGRLLVANESIPPTERVLTHDSIAEPPDSASAESSKDQPPISRMVIPFDAGLKLRQMDEELSGGSKPKPTGPGVG